MNRAEELKVREVLGLVKIYDSSIHSNTDLFLWALDGRVPIVNVYGEILNPIKIEEGKRVYELREPLIFTRAVTVSDITLRAMKDLEHFIIVKDCGSTFTNIHFDNASYKINAMAKVMGK